MNHHVVHLKDRITDAVSAYRAQMIQKKLNAYEEVEDLRKNYEKYTREAVDPDSHEYQVHEISELELEKLVKQLLSEYEDETKETDDEYLLGFISRVRTAWKSGLVCFQDLIILATEIDHLIIIATEIDTLVSIRTGTERNIPWVRENRSLTRRQLIATWLYDNCGKMWVPVDDTDTWEQLQNLYDVFMQEEVQHHVRARWDDVIYRTRFSKHPYQQLPDVQFPERVTDTERAASTHDTRCAMITDRIMSALQAAGLVQNRT
ncbi:hypothetical protein T484DRAFT_1757941 [Baffinella frigidus]|nr:hypothetical protein T484DRAFT_1757941 [Cryptophyta sp. CCMP2293]